MVRTLQSVVQEQWHSQPLCEPHVLLVNGLLLVSCLRYAGRFTAAKGQQKSLPLQFSATLSCCVLFWSDCPCLSLLADTGYRILERSGKGAASKKRKKVSPSLTSSPSCFWLLTEHSCLSHSFIYHVSAYGSPSSLSMSQCMIPLYSWSQFSMNSFSPILLSPLKTHVTFAGWSVLKCLLNTLSRSVFSQETALEVNHLLAIQLRNHLGG